MYLVTISNQIEAVAVKNKKELRALLEKVCPPLGLQYPSLEWVIEKMKLNSRIKLQNGKNSLVICPEQKLQSGS